MHNVKNLHITTSATITINAHGKIRDALNRLFHLFIANFIHAQRNWFALWIMIYFNAVGNPAKCMYTIFLFFFFLDLTFCIFCGGMSVSVCVFFVFPFGLFWFFFFFSLFSQNHLKCQFHLIRKYHLGNAWMNAVHFIDPVYRMRETNKFIVQMIFFIFVC